MTNRKLLLFNELILGPYIQEGNRHFRAGGLKYSSEKMLGGEHNDPQKIAFGVLSSCVYDGFSLKRRDAEREFLKRSGQELCDFLNLHYNFTCQLIELCWEKYDNVSKN